MPLVKLHTSVPVPADKQEPLLKGLSAMAAQAIGKPESYVMVALSEGPMSMGGQPGPAALVDVRSIGGLSGEVNRTISERACQLLGETLAIPPNRVFLNFTEIGATHWGFDGRTFG